MEFDWRGLWEAHSNLFVATNWQECARDKQQKWLLPPGFTYFSGGDMKLRTGLVVKTRSDQEEEFLKAGLLWAARLGNGARTVIYFVAPQFSNRFLRALEELGGLVTGKALYWRERIKPSLFPASAEDGVAQDRTTVEYPTWTGWERQLNPVEASHLHVLRRYFEGLENLGTRIVFKRNRIALYKGNLELAQIRRTGSKIDFTTTARWIGRSAAEQYQRKGWVDVDGNLNAEFQEALEKMIGLVQARYESRDFDGRELLSLMLWEDIPEIKNLWGKSWDMPCLTIDGKPLDTGKVFFLLRGGTDEEEDGEKAEVKTLHVVYPILDKTFVRTAEAIWWYALMREIDKSLPEYQWDGCITCWVAATCQEELRIAVDWIKDRKKFPCYLIDKKWKQSGVLGFKKLD